jgi:hypothetical protein
MAKARNRSAATVAEKDKKARMNPRNRAQLARQPGEHPGAAEGMTVEARPVGTMVWDSPALIVVAGPIETAELTSQLLPLLKLCCWAEKPTFGHAVWRWVA